MKITKENLDLLIEKKIAKGKIELLTVGQMVDKLPLNNKDKDEYYVAAMYVEDRNNVPNGHVYISYCFFDENGILKGAVYNNYYKHGVRVDKVTLTKVKGNGGSFLLFKVPAKYVIEEGK